MNWQIVEIKASRAGNGTPRASIGYNRISLNTQAVKLLESYEEYKFVLPMTAIDDGKLCIGLKFIKEYMQKAITITHKKKGGIDISSKCAAEQLFGEKGTANKTTHYIVKKYDKDILGIIIE